jgi:hypothetical protein
MQWLIDTILGELLGAPTRRLILSIVGPSVMDYLAELERQPLSIRLTIWGIWIVLIYVLTSFANSQWVNSGAKKRAALSADLREFMNQLTTMMNDSWSTPDQHAQLRERIFARLMPYDEGMAHEFMGVMERQGFPTCIRDEIGKLVSFQITSRPRT